MAQDLLKRENSKLGLYSLTDLKNDVNKNKIYENENLNKIIRFLKKTSTPINNKNSKY